MAITSSEVPANALVPFTYVEINPANAGAGGVRFRSLLIGQRLSAGTVAEAVPTPIGTAADARSKFGAGSQLAIMAEAFRRVNPIGQLWGVALDDAAGATAATTTVTVAGTATAAGTIALYIAGRRVAVGVQNAQTAAQVATAINTAVQAAGGGTNGALPVSSGVAAEVVTLTNRNSGASMDVDVRHSYQPDESLPAGITVTVAAGTAGATDPTITTATDAVEDEKFDVIAHPYNAAASMTALEGVLSTRWGAVVQLDGVAFTAYRGTAAAATTYGNARNSPYSSVMGISTSPTSVPAWAGAIAGRVAQSAAADPARPFQTLELTGILSAALTDRFTHAERETILSDGIATHAVDRSGRVTLERVVTTYQTAPGGAADAAYRDANTLFTVSYLRASFRNRMQSRFARHKLANDGTRFGAGQAVVTPSIARAEAINLFRLWEDQGLVEDATAFKEGLVVERNGTDPNRLDFLLTPDLVNQLRVMGAQIAFTLQGGLTDG